MKNYETDTTWTPEKWARFVCYVCECASPRNGYAYDEYNGRARLQDIAVMVDALRLNTNYSKSLELMDRDKFDAVYTILEGDNCHTGNLAFCLAFGDADAVMGALLTVHYMGQNYAIDNNLKYPQTVR